MKRVSKILAREKADALLVWNNEGDGQPATRWLSGGTPTPNRRGNLVWGFTGTSSVLLITRTKRFLITDGHYIAQSRKEAKGCAIHFASAKTSSFELLRRLVERFRVRKILFDGAVTPYSAVEEARAKLLDIAFLSRKRVLQELRIVKEKGELTLLAKAARIACRAFKRLLPLIRINMTENEVARRLEELCIEEGAEGFAFPTIVASGKNGALPHAKTTDKKLRQGELVTIDFGVRFCGYVSDMTRTVAIGKVSAQLRDMYEAVRAAQENGCRKARAGMTGQELDAVCRASLIEKGYGKYFTHGTGHGIGIEVHELPLASQGEAGKSMLSAGSVITCEPGVYIQGVEGVRIEDALVLTKQGNINLTAAISKKFLMLPYKRT